MKKIKKKFINLLKSWGQDFIKFNDRETIMKQLTELITH